MSQFLSAFKLHRISRYEEGEGISMDADSSDVSIKVLLDLVKGIAQQFGGHLVQSMSVDATYAYADINSALNAAIAIQKEFDALNSKNYPAPINLVTIGIVSFINPFTNQREDQRSVELAAFLAESAGAGELYISEGAFNALSDRESFRCRFTRQLMRTGEERALNIYEVFWNPTEVELGKLNRDPDMVDLDIQPIRSFGIKLVITVLLLFFAVLVMTVGIDAIWLFFIKLIYR